MTDTPATTNPQPTREALNAAGSLLNKLDTYYITEVRAASWYIAVQLIAKHFDRFAASERAAGRRAAIEECARLVEQVAAREDESELGEVAADAFNGGWHRRNMTDRLISWNTEIAKGILALADTGDK